MTPIVAKPSIGNEFKQLFKLAIPLIGAQLAQSVTGFVDTIMMGRLGADILAAGGLASLTFNGFLMAVTGIIMGLSPLIAEAYGAENKKKIAKLTHQGFWLVFLLAIPSMVIIAQLDTVMLFLGQAEVTVKIANSYLDAILWGFFPALGFVMLRCVVSALSQTRPIMLIVIAGTVFNVFGNYVLGFGKLGFPVLGLAGLAISSAATHWGMFFALLIYSLKHPQLKKYRLFKGIQPINWEIMVKLLKIGLPISVFYTLEVGLFVTVTYLMGILGTEILAAHQIVLQTIYIVFMIPLGISLATTIRVGQWLGQKNLRGIKLASYLSIASGLVFAIVITIVMLLFPKAVVGLYLDVNDPVNTPIVSLALPMLTVATLAQALDGMQKITYGALQGLQDTRIPVFLSIPAFWGIGLTTGCIFSFVLDWGGAGLWLGQSIGLGVGAILFLLRFRMLIKYQKL